jgi:hypothetical protein
MLVGLGSDYAPRIDRAKRTKRILFVEGRSDVPILKALATTLKVDWPSSWVEWTTTRTQKERKQLFLALEEEIEGLVVLSLRDRDDEPAEGVGADLVDPSASGSINFHPRRWRRRYIESYLIWPSAIATASSLTNGQVTKDLADVHGIAVGAGFTDSDPPQALLDVRGKEILNGSGTLAVSVLDVAQHIESAAICDDIKTFLDDLVKLA